jgi:hypothetical protein
MSPPPRTYRVLGAGETGSTRAWSERALSVPSRRSAPVEVEVEGRLKVLGSGFETASLPPTVRVAAGACSSWALRVAKCTADEYQSVEVMLKCSTLNASELSYIFLSDCFAKMYFYRCKIDTTIT